MNVQIRQQRRTEAKHQCLAAAVIALTVVVGLPACSKNVNSTPSASSGSPSASSGSPSAAQLTVDGQAQPVQGAVTCTPTGVGNGLIIAVGTQIRVEMTSDTSSVMSVGLGTVNGVALQYYKGGYDTGSASAIKDGNTYKVTGNITGTGLNGALKPYELDVTCP